VTTETVRDWRDWVDSHWGDLVALLLLALGILLVVFAAEDSRAVHLGEALVLAAVATLKLNTSRKNGAGGRAGPPA
jgi:hypothetical protein